MKKTKLYFLLMSCSAILSAHTAQAENIPVTFSGFASAGVITGDLNHDFFSGTDVISKSASFGADNKLGLQISAAMSDQVSMTGQLLAKGTMDSYAVDAHWAYIDFHPNSHVSVRAGQLVLPLFSTSEYIDVGYAYPWVRPPIDLYSTIPLSSYSGVDMLITYPFAGFNLLFQPYVGSLPNTRANAFEIQATTSGGFNLVLEHDAGAVRFQYMHINDAEARYENSGTGFSLGADVYAVGFELDKDQVLLMSEYQYRDDTFTQLPGVKEVTGSAWYVTLGYHIGKFLPHITYASADMNKNQMPALQAVMGDLLAQNPALATYLQSNPALMQAFMTNPATALASLDMNDPNVQQLMASINPATLSALASSPELANMQLPPAPLFYKQDSVTVGVRYDILPKTALKLEYQEIKPKEESWGLFLSDPGNKVQLTSFVIDVTF